MFAYVYVCVYYYNARFVLLCSLILHIFIQNQNGFILIYFFLRLNYLLNLISQEYTWIILSHNATKQFGIKCCLNWNSSLKKSLWKKNGTFKTAKTKNTEERLCGYSFPYSFWEFAQLTSVAKVGCILHWQLAP